jgi:ATP phosphoribosyltransferase regulatory subunit
LRFRSEFGRSIGYYTGFIFALREETRGLNLGSGGRYDGLMTALGAPSPMPAVGGALFCTDILAARTRS